MKKTRVLAAWLLVFAMTFPAFAETLPEDLALLPVRALFEEMSGEVSWDGGDRSIQIYLEGNSIVLFAESSNAYVNGQQVTLASDIVLSQGRTYISMDDFMLLIIFAETQAAGDMFDHPDETPEGGVITGALHRIEYGENTVYLFGSLHAARDGWFPLAYIVEDAMRRSDVFGFETDITDILALLTAIEEIAMLPDGLTLDDLLTEEEIEDYIYAIMTFGLTDAELEVIQYLNPAFLSFQFSQVIMLEMADDIEMGEEQSVDAYVLSFAEARGLPVIFLEPAEQQIRILYLPPPEVMAHVARTLQTRDAIVAEFEAAGELGQGLDDLADAYETNDNAGIAAFFAEILEAAQYDIYIDYQREMLYNYRSTYYANEILRLLRETEEPTTFFITVGVSHIMRSLAGEGFTDIVEQLELLGVEVVPLF